MKKDFNQAAKTWDRDAGKVKLAGDVAEAILKAIPLTKDMDAMDYGCGTGLLTLALQPHVKTIIGVDSSRGMLDVLDVKIQERRLANIKTHYLDPVNGNVPNGPFHAITSSMTLHHVQNPADLIRQFYHCLHPGGYLCIADLEPEEGKFHDTNDGVFHFGFAADILRRIFTQAGFVGIMHQTATTITKGIAREGSRSFSVFLMTGQR